MGVPGARTKIRIPGIVLRDSEDCTCGRLRVHGQPIIIKQVADIQVKAAGNTDGPFSELESIGGGPSRGGARKYYVRFWCFGGLAVAAGPSARGVV